MKGVPKQEREKIAREQLRLNMLIARADEHLQVAREQPGRTAAGLNAAMNGVVAHAMVKGNW